MYRRFVTSLIRVEYFFNLLFDVTFYLVLSAFLDDCERELFSKFRWDYELHVQNTDAFYRLVLNDSHCQTLLKNAKYDLFGSEKCQLANLIASRDWLIL